MPEFQHRLSDDDVYDIASSRLDDAERFRDSLRGGWERIARYYRGGCDIRHRQGRSSAVYPVVEKIASNQVAHIIKHTFSRKGLANVVPENDYEVTPCENATRYIQQEFERLNGPAIIQECVLIAVLYGLAIIKVTWDNTNDIRIQKYKDLDGMMVSHLESQDGVEIIDLVETETVVNEIMIPEVGIITQEDARYNVTIKRTVQRNGKVSLDMVDKEDFFHDENAKDLDKNFLILGQTIRVRPKDLIRQGFDKSLVRELAEHSVEEKESYNDTHYTPNIHTKPEDNNYEDKSMVSVELKEVYMWVDVNGSGEAELYRILLSTGLEKIIEKEIVDSTPYVGMNLKPRTDTLIGESLVLKILPEQDYQSMAKREFANHISSLTTPRMSYLNGQVNTLDLKKEAVGSPIRTNTRHAIEVIPQGTVPPNMQESMQSYMKTTEELAGVHSEGTSYNTSNLNNVTTGALNIAANERGTQLSVFGTRSLDCCADVFKKIYRLTIENTDQPIKVFSVETGLGEVDPREWNEDADIRPNVGVSKGTNYSQNQTLESLLSTLTSAKTSDDPPFSVSSKQLMNAFEDYLSNNGIYHTERYATAFTEEQEQAMSEAKAQQAQQAQAGAGGDGGEAYIQGEALKAQTEAGKAKLKMQMDLEKMRMEDDLKRDKMESDLIFNSLKLAAEQGIRIEPEPILEYLQRPRQPSPPILDE